MRHFCLKLKPTIIHNYCHRVAWREVESKRDLSVFRVQQAQSFLDEGLSQLVKDIRFGNLDEQERALKSIKKIDLSQGKDLIRHFCE